MSEGSLEMLIALQRNWHQANVIPTLDTSRSGTLNVIGHLGLVITCEELCSTDTKYGSILTSCANLASSASIYVLKLSGPLTVAGHTPPVILDETPTALWFLPQDGLTPSLPAWFLGHGPGRTGSEWLVEPAFSFLHTFRTEELPIRYRVQRRIGAAQVVPFIALPLSSANNVPYPVLLMAEYLPFHT